ncbi:radical SAM protein [bacterium]
MTDINKVDIKVGYTCNNFCKHCVVGNRREYIQDRSTNEIKQILEESVETAQGVVFTGGEVTLRKDVFELVGFARDLGYEYIEIQTNGRMFAYMEFCRRMVDAGASFFVMALTGHIPEIHNYITGTNSFRQIVKGIVNLKKLKQKVGTNTVVSKINYRHLPDIARLSAKLELDQIQFAFTHILGHAKDNYLSVIPRKAIIMPYIKDGIRIALAADIFPMTEAIPFCFMRDYEAFVAEKYIADAKIYDIGFTIDDFTEVRQAEGKVKVEKCKRCCYYQTCEGPWREYPEIFGWEEFVPVLKSG